MSLSRSKKEARRITQRIAGGVNFGAQSAFAAAYGLLFAFFF
jgi:hypothetical protein